MNIARIHLLLVALTCGVSTAQQFPTTVEFDVVFPRNATYAPTTLLPLVVAIQNPQAAAWLTLNIQWTLLQFGADGTIAEGSIDLSTHNLSSVGSSPYFVVQTTRALNTTTTHEGTFSLIWDVWATNCSYPGGGRTQLGLTHGHNNTIFTIKDELGALPPGPASLIPTAATASNQVGCPAQSFTYNVTGTLPVTGFSQNVPVGYHSDTCGIIANSPPPADPCAATVDSAIVSSMSAGITASLCSAAFPIITGCLANKTSRAAGLSPETGAGLGGLLIGLFLV